MDRLPDFSSVRLARLFVRHPRPRWRPRAVSAIAAPDRDQVPFFRGLLLALPVGLLLWIGIIWVVWRLVF